MPPDLAMGLDSLHSTMQAKGTRAAAAKRKQSDLSGIDHQDSPFSQYSKKKSKIGTGSAESPVEVDASPKKSPRRKKSKGASQQDGADFQEEKRQRRFRAHAPGSYLEIKDRALSQRLTIQGRERCGSEEEPEEDVTIAGTTGNLYTVHIGKVPSCDCPHAKKGNQCKHIIYVMLRVLKAPEHIAYQLALLSSELREVFSKAPPVPTADAEAEESNGNRKPIESDCPICYTEFEPEKEKIVYCKAACGSNIHKDCMQSWAKAQCANASQRSRDEQRNAVTCPMCRAAWESSDLGGKVNLEGATMNEEGYYNVASQLGLSGDRDWTSYHQPWVRSRRGYRRNRYYDEEDVYEDEL